MTRTRRSPFLRNRGCKCGWCTPGKATRLRNAADVADLPNRIAEDVEVDVDYDECGDALCPYCGDPDALRAWPPVAVEAAP